MRLLEQQLQTSDDICPTSFFRNLSYQTNVCPVINNTIQTCRDNLQNIVVWFLLKAHRNSDVSNLLVNTVEGHHSPYISYTNNPRFFLLPACSHVCTIKMPLADPIDSIQLTLILFLTLLPCNKVNAFQNVKHESGFSNMQKK